MAASTSGQLPGSYFKMVRQFPLIRLGNDHDLTAALATIDKLLTRQLDNGEAVYLSALTTLVQTYEREHHPIPDVTPAEVLRELADVNGLTGALLAQQSKIVPSTISALLTGKRRPTPEQMAALAAVFGVSPAVFMPTIGTRQHKKSQKKSPRAVRKAIPSSRPR